MKKLNLLLHRGYPHLLIDRKDNVQLVHNEEVKVGDTLIKGAVAIGAHSMEYTVVDVLESRLAKGDYNGDSPTWYNLKVEKYSTGVRQK